MASEQEMISHMTKSIPPFYAMMAQSENSSSSSQRPVLQPADACLILKG